MSHAPKSYNPLVQSIFDAIDKPNNTRLALLIDEWKTSGQDISLVMDFYSACCKKQGAGLVRVLVDAGLPCDQGSLDLALTRQCWHVAKAMLPVVPHLERPWNLIDGPAAPSALYSAVVFGQVDLARAMLPLFEDAANAANATLHRLMLPRLSPIPEAAPCIAWLVEEGADPNQHLVGRAHPLETALKSGHVEFAVALVQAGSEFKFENAILKVLCCVDLSRLLDPSFAEKRKISPSGWELMEVALASGLSLPPLRKNLLGAYCFEGVKHKHGPLYEADASRFQALIEAVEIGKNTPAIKSTKPSPRF